MKKLTRNVLVVALCLVMSVIAVGSYTLPVSADAGKTAVKFLKGRWYSTTIGENGKPIQYAKFTKKYAKYYEYDANKKKYVYSYKNRIKSAKKSGDGYIIKLKTTKGKKYCYKTAKGDENILEYYGTWKSSKFSSTYHASSSLSRY
ncbi:hypothetical protein SAMN02910358_02065 [Lachnospiraceae bacterium XBB1006]|nr:hypothetical protein SAMN02910358_02065 [Lachnospiraceae bacterium XBB1006]